MVFILGDFYTVHVVSKFTYCIMVLMIGIFWFGIFLVSLDKMLTVLVLAWINNSNRSNLSISWGVLHFVSTYLYSPLLCVLCMINRIMNSYYLITIFIWSIMFHNLVSSNFKKNFLFKYSLLHQIFSLLLIHLLLKAFTLKSNSKHPLLFPQTLTKRLNFICMV